MNCKPGDLAVLVRAIMDPSQLGKIVTIVQWDSEMGGWTVEPPIVTDGRPWRAVNDISLRPIRNPGDDATDEMVLIAGKPEQVTA